MSNGIKNRLRGQFEAKVCLAILSLSMEAMTRNLAHAKPRSSPPAPVKAEIAVGRLLCSVMRWCLWMLYLIRPSPRKSLEPAIHSINLFRTPFWNPSSASTVKKCPVKVFVFVVFTRRLLYFNFSRPQNSGDDESVPALEALGGHWRMGWMPNRRRA